MSLLKGGMLNISTAGTGGSGGSAGVTSIEGLSGVVDLDSPNNSITISTSGQIIRLNALFTPGSGAIVDQNSADIISLSGLISGGVTSVEGLSGIVDFDSTNDGLTIATSGQVIQFTSLFSSLSGSLIDQNSEDIIDLSGLVHTRFLPVDARSASGSIIPDTSQLYALGTADDQWAIIHAVSGHARRMTFGDQDSFTFVNVPLEVSGTLGVCNTAGTARLLLKADGAGFFATNVLSFSDGDRWAIRSHYDGTLDFTNDMPWFPATVRRITIPSGGFIGIGAEATNPQCMLDVSGLICASGARFISERPTVSGIGVALLSDIADTQTSVEGLSGTIDLDSVNNGIVISTSGQVIQFSGLFTSLSGSIIDQNSADVITISGLLYDRFLPVDARQASGSIIPNTSRTYALGTANLRWGDTFATTGHARQMMIGNQDSFSLGAFLEVSGTAAIINNAGTARLFIKADGNNFFAANVLSFSDGDRWTMRSTYNGELQFRNLMPWFSSPVQRITIPSGGFVGIGAEATSPRCMLDVSGLICASGAQFVSDRPTVSGIGLALVTELVNQTSIEGLSGTIDLASPNNSITIGTTSQTINLSAIFTWASGQLLESLINGSGVRALNSVSGLVELTSPDESVNINVNGQTIELSTPGSGAPSGASYLLKEYNDNGHLTAARVLSATSGIRLLDRGVRSDSGLVTTLDFDNEPSVNQVLIWNGTKLQWQDNVGSLSKATKTFTPESGTVFILEHGLATTNFNFTAWRTNDDGDPEEYMIPENVYPSGIDHAVVVIKATDEMGAGVSGKIVFIG